MICLIYAAMGKFVHSAELNHPTRLSRTRVECRQNVWDVCVYNRLASRIGGRLARFGRLAGRFRSRRTVGTIAQRAGQEVRARRRVPRFEPVVATLNLFDQTVEVRLDVAFKPAKRFAVDLSGNRHLAGRVLGLDLERGVVALAHRRRLNAGSNSQGKDKYQGNANDHGSTIPPHWRPL